MFLFLCCYSCILVILPYIAVGIAEDTEGVKRFVIEDELKRAIFGSNKYNPVLQIFEDVNETSQGPPSNSTGMKVTVIGAGGDQATSSTQAEKRNIFRKHVTFATTKPTFWWARSMLRTKNPTRPVTVPRPSILVT